MGNISPHKGKLFSLWCGFKTHFANWETPIQICRISVMFLLCSPLEVSRATDARAASLTPQRGGRGGNRYHGVCDPPMVTSMVQIWTKHIDHNMDLRTLALNFRTFFAEKPTMGDAFVPRMAETCGSPHLQCLARAPFFQGLNWKIYIYIYTYNVYIYNNCKQPSAAAFLFFLMISRRNPEIHQFSALQVALCRAWGDSLGDGPRGPTLVQRMLGYKQICANWCRNVNCHTTCSDRQMLLRRVMNKAV